MKDKLKAIGNRISNSVFEPHTHLSVAAFIFIMFFVLCMTAYIMSGKELTFTAVLDYLGNYHSDYSFTAYFATFSNLLTITSDWGMFNFFRDFLNIFMGALGFIVRAIGGLLDIVKFLGDVFVNLL